MSTGKFLLLAVAIAALAVVMLPAGVSANALTYTPTPVGVGQTMNDPCVIGDPSCDAGISAAAALTYTVSSGPCTGGNCLFNSPVYTATAGITPPLGLPTTFEIGVDENVAAGQSTEVLQFFKLWLCSGTTFATCTTVVDSTSGTNPLVDENNGNGHTDGLITGFSTLTIGNHYAFQASWSNDTDGMEQFWIVPAGTPPPPVPEPGTVGMLGLGLLGLVGLSWRSKNLTGRSSAI